MYVKSEHISFYTCKYDKDKNMLTNKIMKQKELLHKSLYNVEMH